MTRAHAATGCLLVLASCGEERIVDSYGGEGGSYNQGGGYGECEPGWCQSVGPGVGCEPCGGSPPYVPGVPDCYDESGELQLDPAIAGGVEIHQNLCTPAQINDVLAACVDREATQESCDAFVAAAAENQACLDCVLGGGQQPYAMPVAFLGNYPLLSLPACQAEVAGLPECELPYQDWYSCGYAACQSCTTDDAQEDCFLYALFDSVPCGSIEIPESCDPLLIASEWPEECIGNANTFTAAFPIMADFYCGAP